MSTRPVTPRVRPVTLREVAGSRFRLVIAFPFAVIGGYLLDIASPSVAFWPASFLGAALIFAALWGQRARWGLAIGAVAGAAFWGPHIFWLTLYLGPVPWLGLAGFMAFWFALFGAAVSFVTTAGAGMWGLRAAAVAGLWVLREQIAGSWPYEGFAWGRLAHMQADGPLAQAVSWTGFAGLSGLVALAAALPVAAFFNVTRREGAVAASTLPVILRQRRAERASASRSIVGSLAASLALILILALIPPASLGETGSMTVGAVQGNSKSGIFDDRDSGDVLRDHVAATETMLDELEDAGKTVDVIVWPENSAEFDLPSNVLAKQQLAKLSARAEAPIVLGTVIAEDGEYTNSSLVWGPRGDEGPRYDKRYPVPFAEYMPNRSFYRMLAPELVDLVQLEYEHGELSPVIEVDTGAGSIAAGIAICFDIIFDRQAVAMVDDGAQVVFAQTNNADFGRTDESAQQLAIARLRAIETGRALVNISTVGTSAVVAPEGHDIARLPTHTAAAMVAEVPLVDGKTPALRFGALVAALWIGLGLAALAAAGLSGVSSRIRGVRAES